VHARVEERRELTFGLDAFGNQLGADLAANVRSRGQRAAGRVLWRARGALPSTW
jgi:hypothetical protein